MWSADEVNVLSNDKYNQVIALGRLRWSLREIENATGVRRETASAYLKAAGIPVRSPRARQAPGPSKPASEAGVSTDSGGEPASKPASGKGVSTASEPACPGRAPAASACEPYRELIEAAVRVGRNAMAIYQDLVELHGFSSEYASVKRFVRKLRGTQTPEEKAVIETPPGREAQVDYGEGPMVRHPETGKYRRMRLFVLTLGFSRKSVRLLVWKSDSKTWSQLHEQAFRRLGGVTATVVLDNLKEGVLSPDIYDPTLNPLYRDVLAHYGVTALPCRVRDPDRKGKVESGIGHTQRTPLKGLRFENIEDAQKYLDRWDERWADTRIHGTTKRQVAAMFADEQPHLRALPVEPFRYYQYGERVVHLDGCVEVDRAYYHAPPGWIGRTVLVQWDGLRVRLLDKSSGQLLREHLVTKPGGRRVLDEDRPTQTPRSTLYYLGELARVGHATSTLANGLVTKHGDEDVIRKLQGVRSLIKKYGAPIVEEAAAALLELGLCDYRALRRYLERRPTAPLSLAQIDPLIRQLTHYRELIDQKTEGDTP
jgi:transposase